MRVFVVIPAYKVTEHVTDVIARIGPEVERILVVDDACPDGSGDLVERQSDTNRVEVIRHPSNFGVGGAVVTGYKRALELGADVVVKLDGDGQMHPEDISRLLLPIELGEADYSKGNRFDSLDDLSQMPKIRIFGNAVLSIWSKVASGYWSITDPTNGFTAIHRTVLDRIELNKLSRGYFFESDILFRLNLAGAVVEDVGLPARYSDEKSNLRIRRVIWEFPLKHTRNLLKRLFYRYYLREWSIGTFELPASILFATFGIIFGVQSSASATAVGKAATAGQVTVSAIAIILGAQLFLSFLNSDIQAEPRIPRQRRTT